MMTIECDYKTDKTNAIYNTKAVDCIFYMPKRLIEGNRRTQVIY
mgnify:CR=1 FL=1